jgi:flagellar biogenesis protein FliO
MNFRIGGLAGRLVKRMRRDSLAAPRLMLIERISLAPRQSLVLIEAEGRRFLVATSQEGAPSFYPLDHDAFPERSHSTRCACERGDAV